MQFCILIKQPPYERQASVSALNFARAVLAGGHEINRVFFYQGGVMNASTLIEAPQNELQLPSLWAALAQEHNLDLAVCIAAGKRRGVLEKNLHEGFNISGLGQLLDASIEADRLVCFN